MSSLLLRREIFKVFDRLYLLRFSSSHTRRCSSLPGVRSVFARCSLSVRSVFFFPERIFSDFSSSSPSPATLPYFASSPWHVPSSRIFFSDDFELLPPQEAMAESF
ncbi:hypothetical protein KSP39_PZI010992 [Platanthera zijinensis]|uniref:Uncharacterized protein n=1 Tax=Platanthera zijinensis TaxID=2320716 RepID=A0AAP0G5W9_9ASPA